MRVVIDGVEYAPTIERSSPPRIGISITTHNRPDVLKRALEQHQRFLPPGAHVVVVDDGSTAPLGTKEVKTIRHPTPKGIVAAKNASMKALMDAGCEHLFLWDDDAWPIAAGWHEPYIASAEPHLAYQFLDLKGPRKLNDIAVLHDDGVHIAYTGQRGVMLYYHRSAIEKVGGFDWIYGRGMYEHSDLALRIYHAGLTSWAFADVQGSDALIHSMDEHEEVQRSVSQRDREALVRRNADIHNRRRNAGYTAYVPLIEPVDVVLTTLLTASPDPQRGKPMETSPELLVAWASSIKGARAVVLADHLDQAPAGADIERVPAVKGNPYFLRWLHIYRWLRDHPEVRLVWATDGTDVEMLREPWAAMEPGKLYLGSEPKTLADEWMRKNHPASHLQAFMAENGNRLLLNAGLVGGDRDTVMSFAHDMVRDWHATASRRFWKKEQPGAETGDMATLNFVAGTRWSDRVVTGPQVHTVFRTEGLGRETAWWKHK